MSYDPADLEEEQQAMARALKGNTERIAAEMMRSFPMHGVCEGQVEPGVVLPDGRVIAANDYGRPVLLKRAVSWA